METITHVHTPPMGSVDAKLSHSTTGITLELDVTRPRQDGETFEDAAQRTAELAASAYTTVVRELANRGVHVGPFKKPEGK
jgi:hypothetical protein